MKKSKLMLSFMALALAATSLAGCNGKTWDFSVSVDKPTIRAYETANVVLTYEKEESVTHTFAFSSSDATIASVDTLGVITGLSKGTVKITVVADGKPELTHDVSIQVLEPYGVDGAYTYAGASYQQKGEILGKLEEYALDNHFSGLPLFENGGLVMYSDRVVKGTNNYITGYGFGILGEGNITSPLEKEQNPDWKMYYHQASASDSYDINAWDADGSEVSDRASYISSGYWDAKMNATKDGYDWYPVLAKEMPQPVNAGADGLATTWKFKVRTEADGLKYTTLTTKEELKGFNGRGVKLEDYLYVFKMLCAGKNNLYRGAEMAGDTGTGAIVGIASYFNATKTTGESDEAFDSLVAIKADPTDNSLQFTFTTPMNSFYAMYYLASGLYQPIPKDFITAVGGPKLYGRAGEATGYTPVDSTLSLAPYTLEFWTEKQQIAFKRNPTWFQFSDPALSERYKIEGVHIRINSAMASDPEAGFNMFMDGLIDATGLPQSKVAQYKNDPRTTHTTGDSVFKLNINSCNEFEWEEKFGINGTITQTDPANYWDVKPWMSNSSFLDGIFLSLNRQEFADNRGVIPSSSYFASAYLIDPENGISYNNTDAHKQAISGYYPETFGYNLEASKVMFGKAVNELVDAGDLELGTADNPTEISIKITWMYQSDIQDYGNDITRYIEDAFNDPSVCGGKVHLTVEQDAVSTWSDVYYKVMMVGQFDLAFGSISGNTLNPLNFMEVLKSDNSSGFTLNWGLDTNLCTEEHHIEYDGKNWSFNALWAAADHGALVRNGSEVPIVEALYMDFTREDNWVVTEAGTTIIFDLYLDPGVALDGIFFAIEGLTIYDGKNEIDLSEFVTVEEDPADPYHAVIKLSLDAETFAALNAIVAADLGAPAGTTVLLLDYYGYFEFVFYYYFEVFGVGSDLYIEILSAVFPEE